MKEKQSGVRRFKGEKLLFLLTVLLGLFLGSVTANAAADLNVGVSGISNNQVLYMGHTTKDAAFDGETAGKTVSWLVLNKDKANNGSASGMYLVTSDLLGKNKAGGGISFGESSAWVGSNAAAWCQNFFSNALSSPEQGAVLPTTIKDKGYFSGFWGLQYDPISLSGEKIFFLSTEEAERYFSEPEQRLAKYNGKDAIWYLRSPGTKSYEIDFSVIGAIYTDGTSIVVTTTKTDLNPPESFPEEVKKLFKDISTGDHAARPAFNLDKSKVLFSSAAKGGKLSETEGVTGLVANTPSSASEWKLTLLDKDMGLKLGKAAIKANILTIPYSEATIGKNRYVSAIVKNAEGEITYYGRLAANAEGKIKINLFDYNIGKTDELYLFTEECNGDDQTDYASELKLVKFSWKGAANALDVTKVIPLTVVNKSTGTVGIKNVQSNARSIVITGTAINMASQKGVRKPIAEVLKGAFSKAKAKTVTFDLSGSATRLKFKKQAFSKSKVKKLILIGRRADIFKFNKGAFKGSKVKTIIVKGMSDCQYGKLQEMLWNAGYRGNIQYVKE